MKLKEVTKFLVDEGKNLPRPIWIMALVMPFGLQIVGAYMVGKAILRKNK